MGRRRQRHDAFHACLRARREAPIRPEPSVGKTLAMAGNPHPLSRRDDLEPRLSDHPDPMLSGDLREHVGGHRVVAGLTSRATDTCASTVDAPRCGVRTTFGSWSKG